jgi:hypothetical protein
MPDAPTYERWSVDVTPGERPVTRLKPRPMKGTVGGNAAEFKEIQDNLQKAEGDESNEA